MDKQAGGIRSGFLAVFFFAVQTAVGLAFFVGQKEDMRQPLFNGGDAAGIFAVEHIGDPLGETQGFLFNDFTIPNDIDGNVVIDKAQDVEIDLIQASLDFDNVLSPHFIAAGVFDDGNFRVHLVKS